MQLHKRDVVDAATALLDGYGIADLTMRRLARELDVSPGALYWHFVNKQQLLGAVADRILQPACADPAAMGWRRRIEVIGARLRDALLSHTDGAELVSASFAAGQSRAATDIVCGLADAAGALAQEQSVLSVDPSAQFAFGLRLLIDGIAAHRAETELTQQEFE